MNRQANTVFPGRSNRRFSRCTDLYETRATTWVTGVVIGTLLGIGLSMAGDGYVRVATGNPLQHVPGVTKMAQK